MGGASYTHWRGHSDRHPWSCSLLIILAILQVDPGGRASLRRGLRCYASRGEGVRQAGRQAGRAMEAGSILREGAAGSVICARWPREVSGLFFSCQMKSRLCLVSYVRRQHCLLPWYVRRKGRAWAVGSCSNKTFREDLWQGKGGPPRMRPHAHAFVFFVIFLLAIDSWPRMSSVRLSATTSVSHIIVSSVPGHHETHGAETSHHGLSW